MLSHDAKIAAGHHELFSLENVLQTLLLIAEDDGRGQLLFGESINRAKRLLPDYLVGKTFPNVYLEFPLMGEPFLDVSVGYKDFPAGEGIRAPSAEGTQEMLDWFSGTAPAFPGISCGYELDLKHKDPSKAGIYFHPDRYRELVLPFCRTIGEDDKAQLYLNAADRLPAAWKPSYFGLFRGRPDAPFRIGGYLSDSEMAACVKDPGRIHNVFDRIGFRAYHSEMLRQMSELLAAVPGYSDFQFDVFLDGTFGDTFSLDVYFPFVQPEEMPAYFQEGEAAKFMKLLNCWKVADARLVPALEMAFEGAIPVNEDLYIYFLRPNWLKVRWIQGTLQPAKLYVMMFADSLTEKE